MSLSNPTVDKCRIKLQADQFDTDSAVTHYDRRDGFTLCSRRIGREQDGWFRNGWHIHGQATCKHCLRVAGKAAPRF